MRIENWKTGARALVATAVLLAAGTAGAKILLTQTEALRLAFPGAAVERKTAYLTDFQRSEALRLSGAEALPPSLVTFYFRLRDGRLVGTAYFDTHLVRTLPETVMVVVDPAGAIARVEVLSFSEPEDYLPRPSWYGQFAGKPTAWPAVLPAAATITEPAALILLIVS